MAEHSFGRDKRRSKADGVDSYASLQAIRSPHNRWYNFSTSICFYRCCMELSGCWPCRRCPSKFDLDVGEQLYVADITCLIPRWYVSCFNEHQACGVSLTKLGRLLRGQLSSTFEAGSEQGPRISYLSSSIEIS
jgi:hypothetical protein